VVSFEDTVNPAGVEQPACTLCGDCCSGCNVGAKNTIALTYLPDAKAHGAEIFTELTVSHVAREGRHWRVHFAPTEEPDAPQCSVKPDRGPSADNAPRLEILPLARAASWSDRRALQRTATSSPRSAQW
jgi:hypothetical protein